MERFGSVKMASAYRVPIVIGCSIIVLFHCIAEFNTAQNKGKENFIDFKVLLENVDSIPILILKNISDKPIQIEVPRCAGINIWPVLFDVVDNKELGNKFKAKAPCPETLITLQPSEEYKSGSECVVWKCFDLQDQKEYELYFEYSGVIYDLAKKQVANDIPLKSNRVKFTYTL